MNKVSFEKMTVRQLDYCEGVIQKCAKHGVDPDLVLEKLAQFFEGMGNVAQGYGQNMMGGLKAMNPGSWIGSGIKSLGGFAKGLWQGGAGQGMQQMKQTWQANNPMAGIGAGNKAIGQGMQQMGKGVQQAGQNAATALGNTDAGRFGKALGSGVAAAQNWMSPAGQQAAGIDKSTMQMRQARHAAQAAQRQPMQQAAGRPPMQGQPMQPAQQPAPQSPRQGYQVGRRPAAPTTMA